MVEVLDNWLARDIKPGLLRLIEPEDMDGRAARFSVNDARVVPVSTHLQSLAGDARAATLVRVCAGYAAARLGAASLKIADIGGGTLIVELQGWIQAGCPAIKERGKMLAVEKMLVLKGVDLFSSVRVEYLASAAASAAEVRLAAGQPLFSEGDFGTALFVVVSGRLEVVANGKRIAELGEREVVGEMAALDPEPRSATVRAMEESLLLKLTSEDLDVLMSEDVEVARGIIHTLCRRLRGSLRGSLSS